MDKLNLEVTMKSGDGSILSIQEELIREEQSDIVGKFLRVCEYQLSNAKSDVASKNNRVENEVAERLKSMAVKHQNEITRNTAKTVEISEDDTTSAARAALQKAQIENLLASQKAELEKLKTDNEKYRSENLLKLVTVPELESRLIKLRKDFNENKKVNRRRRAPANARYFVECSKL